MTSPSTTRMREQVKVSELEQEIARLRSELFETRRLRDQWCAEYVKVRDELKDLRGVPQ